MCAAKEIRPSLSIGGLITLVGGIGSHRPEHLWPVTELLRHIKPTVERMASCIWLKCDMDANVPL